MRTPASPRRRLIYIPLCFYFILKDITLERAKKHLHSTMLLLYLGCRGEADSRISIYIPLCFYFIKETRTRKERKSYLHSTMLLLYQIGKLVKKDGTIFTFHYASTLSRMEEVIQAITFNLHSTMLLLYRSLQESVLNNICIYIPLCFYFISTFEKFCSAVA